MPEGEDAAGAHAQLRMPGGFSLDPAPPSRRGCGMRPTAILRLHASAQNARIWTLKRDDASREPMPAQLGGYSRT